MRQRGRLNWRTDTHVFIGNGDGIGDRLTDFATYVAPFDSEHLLSVAFHVPRTTPLPAPRPAPVAVLIDTITPTVYGMTIKIDATSIVKYQDGFGPRPQVGDCFQGKARVLIKGDVG